MFDWEDIVKTRDIQTRYKFEDIPLTSGGFGEIWLADDTLLHRKVIAKVLKTNVLRNNDLSEQDLVYREAQAASQVSPHRSILPVVDLCRTEDKIYLFFEFVDGVNLKTLIESIPPTHKTVWPPLCVYLTYKIASVVHCLHESDVVHRDIKPANILISKNGDIILGDFGIAKDVGRAQIEGSTNEKLDTLYKARTPAFDVPTELVENESESQSRDMYQLGRTLCSMFSQGADLSNPGYIGTEEMHKYQNIDRCVRSACNIENRIDTPSARALVRASILDLQLLAIEYLPIPLSTDKFIEPDEELRLESATLESVLADLVAYVADSIAGA